MPGPIILTWSICNSNSALKKVSSVSGNANITANSKPYFHLLPLLSLTHVVLKMRCLISLTVKKTEFPSWQQGDILKICHCAVLSWGTSPGDWWQWTIPQWWEVACGLGPFPLSGFTPALLCWQFIYLFIYFTLIYRVRQPNCFASPPLHSVYEGRLSMSAAKGKKRT